MPKIIPELRDKLIEAAKTRIRETESHDFTMRQIAADIGTAVGTVYNYFPSKEYLMAAVMLEDWGKASLLIHEAAQTSPDVEAGVRAIDNVLREFVEKYRPAWNAYSLQANVTGIIGKYHGNLIKQIEKSFSLLLERFGADSVDHAALILSEMLLVICQRDREALELAMPSIKRITERLTIKSQGPKREKVVNWCGR